MWWIIGALIGTAWNLHDEKRNPEIRTKREAKDRADRRDCFILLAIFVVGLPFTLIAGSAILNPAPSGSPARSSRATAVPSPVAAPLISPDVKAPAVPAPETPVLAEAPIPSLVPLPKAPAEPNLGTDDTNFAKDWVIVAGKKIEGITNANPAPNGEVEILYLNGVGNFPASSLPRGFLDAWQVTPEKLKAAQNQK